MPLLMQDLKLNSMRDFEATRLRDPEDMETVEECLSYRIGTLFLFYLLTLDFRNIPARSDMMHITANNLYRKKIS